MSSSSSLFISQEYFDELCVENWETFYDDRTDESGKHQAVLETVEQLQKNNRSITDKSNRDSADGDGLWLSHLSLTYPDETDASATQIRARIRTFQTALLSLQDKRSSPTCDSDNDNDNDATITSRTVAVAAHLETIRLELGLQNCNKQQPSAAEDDTLFGNLFRVHDGCATLCALLSTTVVGLRLLPANNNDDDDGYPQTLSVAETILSTIMDWLLPPSFNNKNSSSSSSTNRQTRRSAFQTAVPVAMPAILTLWEQLLQPSVTTSNNSNGEPEPLSSSSSSFRCYDLVLQTVLASVSRCESNKKIWMNLKLTTTTTTTTNRSFAALMVQSLAAATPTSTTTATGTPSRLLDKDDNETAPWDTAAAAAAAVGRTICSIMTCLCTFDDFRVEEDASPSSTWTPPVVQSGHTHVQALADEGAVATVHEFLLFHHESSSSSNGINNSSCTKNAGAVAAAISTLRAMSIEDTIVQSMERMGIMETATRILQVSLEGAPGDGAKRMNEEALPIVTSILGLFRNVSANDNIKTTLCVGKHRSVVGHLVQAMETYPNAALLQEHACGLVAAMALRKPKNAHALVEACAHRYIVHAMERHSDCATLQRQAALALRNVAARSPELHATILEDSNAEAALRTKAAKHLGCQDEVYAALRDLGLSAPSVHVHHLEDGQVTVQNGPQMFGERNPNFRPVYED